MSFHRWLEYFSFKDVNCDDGVNGEFHDHDCHDRVTHFHDADGSLHVYGHLRVLSCAHHRHRSLVQRRNEHAQQ